MRGALGLTAASTAHEASLPPGPRAPALVQAARFGADPYGYLRELERAHGDTFTLRLPGDPPRVCCSHPDDVKAIFALRAEDFRQSEASIPLSLGTSSLLLLDGDRHARERKLIVPTLLGEDLDRYATLMRDTTRRAIARWQVGSTLRLDEALRAIALETICRCVFGIEGERVEEASRLTREWIELAFSPRMFIAGVLLSAGRVRAVLDAVARDSPARRGGSTARRVLPWQRVADRKAALMRLLDEEIAAARAAPPGDDRADVLTKLTRARFEDGTAMTDAELVDELVTLLIGGHETTATSMSWALLDVLGRPDVLARVRRELDAETTTDGASLARPGRLPYLEACIRESMRISPVAIAIPRYLVRPLALRRATVPAGTFVWACSVLTQRSADNFPDPEAFRPERFLEGKPTGEQHYPFGGGRRRCAGMTFAAVEMRVVLAEILASADLELASDRRSRPIMRGITMSPDDGVPVIARGVRRAPSAAGRDRSVSS